MALRPGSIEASQLFNGPVDEKLYRDLLRCYENAVFAVGKGKKKNELIEWDSFLWSALPDLVKSREPKHLKLAELAEVMKWKLSRGKARPLQKLVESNTESAVLKASVASFHLLSNQDWEGAINEITVLKGVGVATATAILAPFAPADVPFMADEVMEAVSCQRDYTLKIYKDMRLRLTQKAKELQSVSEGHNWTAEDVGKALWVRAMMVAYPSIHPTSSENPSKVLKGKRCNEEKHTLEQPQKSLKEDRAAVALGDEGGSTKRQKRGK